LDTRQSSDRYLVWLGILSLVVAGAGFAFAPVWTDSIAVEFLMGLAACVWLIGPLVIALILYGPHGDQSALGCRSALLASSLGQLLLRCGILCLSVSLLSVAAFMGLLRDLFDLSAPTIVGGLLFVNVILALLTAWLVRKTAVLRYYTALHQEAGGQASRDLTMFSARPPALAAVTAAGFVFLFALPPIELSHWPFAFGAIVSGVYWWVRRSTATGVLYRRLSALSLVAPEESVREVDRLVEAACLTGASS